LRGSGVDERGGGDLGRGRWWWNLKRRKMVVVFGFEEGEGDEIDGVVGE